MKPEDLRELKLKDPEQVKRIAEMYNALDVPRENVLEFTHHLVNRADSWFVEVGDVGLVYFTHIIPRLDARFNLIFWDKKLTADRRELAKLAISAAFKHFALRRLTAVVVESNVPLRNTLQKIGFTTEGVLRQSRIVGTEYVNTYHYGLLSEEITWPVLTTSLA